MCIRDSLLAIRKSFSFNFSTISESDNGDFLSSASIISSITFLSSFVDAVLPDFLVNAFENKLFKLINPIGVSIYLFFTTLLILEISLSILFANKIDKDISSISRVVKNKYIDTPIGLISLKSLFSNALTKKSGKTASTNELKKVMLEIIDAEDKKSPLSDSDIVEKLNEKDFLIARRLSLIHI